MGATNRVSWLRRLFGLSTPVDRRQYLTAGLILMALKYGLDAGAYYLANERILDPLRFLSPLMHTRLDGLGDADPALLTATLVWSLIFLWIGASMTLRRAVDAGQSPWLVILFLVPGVNLIVMAILAYLPTRARTPDVWYAEMPEPQDVARARSALLGAALGLLIALTMTGISAFVLEEYGTTLFFTTPFAMGAASSYVFNRRHPRTMAMSVSVAVASLFLASVALLLFALEGVFCLILAFVPATGAAIFGAVLGRAIALQFRPTSGSLAALILLLPFSAGAEAYAPGGPLREVETHVVIDAPPRVVWDHVVGFTELPPPKAWIFQLGIAYPMSARIRGVGPGAIRRCEFSTGAFVEPITHWDPPRRLAFDVRSQPAPLEEWSPYRHVHPPHLDGYLMSRRGEFRLVPLDGGARTRLEGSTWYTLDLFPHAYWVLWSDWLIHGIHRRVLDHVKTLAETKEADQTQFSVRSRLGVNGAVSAKTP